MVEKFDVITREKGVKLVVPAGELDHWKGTPKLERTLAQFEGILRVRLIVDFHATTYMCSAAAASLVHFSEKLKKNGGELFCCRFSAAVKDVMDVLDIPEVVRCFDSLEDAVAAAAAAVEEKQPPPGPS